MNEVFNFLENELPDTLNQLAGASQKETAKNSNLINVADSLEQSKMPYYQHSVVKVKLLGQYFSTAILYKTLDQFYEGIRKNNLYLFNDFYRRNSTAQQIDFYEKLDIKMRLIISKRAPCES